MINIIFWVAAAMILAQAVGLVMLMNKLNKKKQSLAYVQETFNRSTSNYSRAKNDLVRSNRDVQRLVQQREDYRSALIYAADKLHWVTSYAERDPDHLAQLVAKDLDLTKNDWNANLARSRLAGLAQLKS